MSDDKPLERGAAEDQPTTRWRRARDKVAKALAGKHGITIAAAFLVLGQLVWLLPREGATHLALADVLAIEAIVVAIAFGVLALATAFQHAAELGHVAGKLTDVSQELEDVSHSVLTHTLGEFPSFVPDVCRLVERADTSIRILCDNPAYAVVSKGDSFDTYLKALRTAIDTPGVEVDLMFLDDKEREQLHGDQVARNLGAERRKRMMRR